IQGRSSSWSRIRVIIRARFAQGEPKQACRKQGAGLNVLKLSLFASHFPNLTSLPESLQVGAIAMIPPRFNLKLAALCCVCACTTTAFSAETHASAPAAAEHIVVV